MSNVELISRWYTAANLDQFLKLLSEGDLLEFEVCDLYHHWAVCVSTRQGGVVVHRTGYVSAFGFVSESQSLDKPGHGIGEIEKHSLREALGDSRIRINNAHDAAAGPRKAREIVAFALNAIGSDALGEYSVVTNNCEHFVNMCRYGDRRSGQVQDAAMVGAAALGVVAIVGAVSYLWGSLTSSKEKPERH